jgi:hypothetical protein
MVTAKWCNNNINSGKFTFKSIMGEVKELFETQTLDELKDEFGDVLYFTYCWLYSKFGINLPMVGAMGSVRKFTNRLDIWKLLFQHNDLDFHPKYLINGSNYRKEYKVNLALELARKEQKNDIIHNGI